MTDNPAHNPAYPPPPQTVRSPWLTTPYCDDLLGPDAHNAEIESEQAERGFTGVSEDDEQLVLDGIAAREVVTRIAPGLVMTEHPPEIITCLNRETANPSGWDDSLTHRTIRRHHWASRIQVKVTWGMASDGQSDYPSGYHLFRRALEAVTPAWFQGADWAETWYMSDVDYRQEPDGFEPGGKWVIEIFQDLGTGAIGEEFPDRHTDQPLGANDSWADRVYVLLYSIAEPLFPPDWLGPHPQPLSEGDA